MVLSSLEQTLNSRDRTHRDPEGVTDQLLFTARTATVQKNGEEMLQTRSTIHAPEFNETGDLADKEKITESILFS
jgi:hypothetical protein